MALANYNDLLAGVETWLARSDLTALIPTFVSLAETELNRTLRTAEMEIRAIATTADGSGNPSRYIELPSDYQAMRRLKLTNSFDTVLEYMTPSALDVAYGDTFYSARPTSYTITGSQVQLGPIPDAVYDLEMIYYQKIPSLEQNVTNWLMTKHPDAYLYGTLMKAQAYMRDDARLVVWKQQYTEALEQIAAEDQSARYNGAPIRQRAAGPFF